MKKLLVLSVEVFCLLFLMSCRKEQGFVYNNLKGTWEIHKSYGWPESKFYESGNGNKIEFVDNRTVNRYVDNKIVSTTNYRISKYKGDCDYAKDDWSIHFSDRLPVGLPSITVKGDTLILSGPPCWQDVGTNYYLRVKE